MELRDNGSLLVCAPCEAHRRPKGNMRAPGVFKADQSLDQLRGSLKSGNVKSCTVIQEDLFTESTGLYKGLENILYFYHKCVLKVSCEAVCEGAGGVNNKHAGKRRSSISPEHVEQEAAFIDWPNGRPPASLVVALRGKHEMTFSAVLV